MQSIRRVLLLDDDPAMLRLLVTSLRSAELEIVACSEIEAAECLLPRAPFDVFVCDLRLSDLGGVEGLRIIRQVSAHFPETEILVFSGILTDEIRELARNAGSRWVLEKPNDLGRLREIVQRRPAGRPAVHDSPADGLVVLVERLEQVIASRRIRAVLQPIIDLQAPSEPPRAIGVESLARGPRGSVLESPEVLFSYAERKQRLFETDMVCVDAAFRAARDLPHPTTLFVNIQPRSMSNPSFCERLIDMARGGGLPTDSLVVELTEQQTVVNPDAFASTLDELRSHGLRIALDDYGEGFSNLDQVQDLQPDFLKISGRFCRGIEEDVRKRVMVSATVRLASELGIQTVMEQVETAEELAVVRDLGVQYGQGYCFAKPAPAADLASSIAFAPLEKPLLWARGV